MEETKKNFGVLIQIVTSIACSGVLLKILRVRYNDMIQIAVAIILFYAFSYMHKKFELRKFTYLSLFSVPFSLSLLLSWHIQHSSNLYSGGSDINYFTDSTRIDFFRFIALTLAVLAILYFLSDMLRNQKCLGVRRETSSKKAWLILGFVIFLCWFPYILTYYPGLIYGDSLGSVKQALGISHISNHHPVFYTLWIKASLLIGKQISDTNFGCAIYTVSQMLYVSMVLSYIVLWLYGKGVSKVICGFITALYALAPVYAIHAISMWKDPVFSATLAFLSLKLYDAMCVKPQLLSQNKFLATYLISSVVICLSRNNGFYIMIFVTVFMVILMAMHRYRMRKYMVCSILLLAGVKLLTGPIYTGLGINSPSEENFGIPLQQIARVVVYDREYDTEEAEFIDKILPIEKYKEVYTPCCVDSLKWDKDFDKEFLSTHKKEFIETWFRLFLKNPREYVKGWSLMTFGYWAFNCWEFNFMEGNLTVIHDSEENGITQKDLLMNKFGLSLKDYIPLKGTAVSPNILIWVVLFSIVLLLYKKRELETVIFLPMLGAWLTLMVASPLAYWLRYLLVMVYMFPVILFVLLNALGQRQFHSPNVSRN